MIYDGIISKPPLDDVLAHHGILGQKWGKKNGPPYPLDSKVSTGKRLKDTQDSSNNDKFDKLSKFENFNPFKAMDKIDKSLSKKEQNYLGVGNDNTSSDDMKFFFDKDKTAYLMTIDYHGKYKDEHPISGKIIGIAAKKEARGKGITDKLISNAKKEFKNDRLVAEIDKENVASIKLFERNGFKKKMSDDYIDYYIWENKKKE